MYNMNLLMCNMRLRMHNLNPQVRNMNQRVRNMGRLLERETPTLCPTQNLIETNGVKKGPGKSEPY